MVVVVVVDVVVVVVVVVDVVAALMCDICKNTMYEMMHNSVVCLLKRRNTWKTLLRISKKNCSLSVGYCFCSVWRVCYSDPTFVAGGSCFFLLFSRLPTLYLNILTVISILHLQPLSISKEEPRNITCY